MNLNTSISLIKSRSLLFFRFYGPMVFYLVWNKLCDNYIAYQLSKLDFDDAYEVIRLYGLIHPTSKTGSEIAGSSSSESSDSSDDESSDMSFESKVDLVRLYIKHDSLQETKLNIALESMLEQRSAQVLNDEENSVIDGSTGPG